MSGRRREGHGLAAVDDSDQQQERERPGQQAQSYCQDDASAVGFLR